jgi:hypothetical protein
MGFAVQGYGYIAVVGVGAGFGQRYRFDFHAVTGKIIVLVEGLLKLGGNAAFDSGFDYSIRSL